MKMSRQGPGAPWKWNSWSITACCHVDTHSIATLCCPASQGDAAPAPRSWKCNIQGEKYWNKPKQRRDRKRYLHFELLLDEPVGFWIFQRFFSFFFFPLIVLLRCYNILRWTGPRPSAESKIFLSRCLCSALIQPENPQMSKSVGTSHGFL